MKEFVGLRAKTYAYLMVDYSEYKKAKETKKCLIKKNCWFNNIIILRSQHRFKTD